MRRTSGLTAIVSAGLVAVGAGLDGCGYSPKDRTEYATTNTLGFDSGNQRVTVPAVKTDKILIRDEGKERSYLGLALEPYTAASQIREPQRLLNAKLIPDDNYNNITSSAGWHEASAHNETYFLPNVKVERVGRKDVLMLNLDAPPAPIRVLLPEKPSVTRRLEHRTDLSFSDVLESQNYDIRTLDIKGPNGEIIERLYATPANTSTLEGSQPMLFFRRTDGEPEVLVERRHRLVDGRPVVFTETFLRDVMYAPFKDTEFQLPYATLAEPVAEPRPEPTLAEPVAEPRPEPSLKKDPVVPCKN
jgi:hypothetical protein